MTTTLPDVDPTSAEAVEATASAPVADPTSRLRTAVLASWAAITGAAPHVLHHVGPLAGTALVAGVGGRTLFALAGFVATIPMLRRLRRRTGDWRAPGLALAGFAAVYALSTIYLGPAVGAAAGPDVGGSAPLQAEVDHHGHDVTGR